MSADDKRILVIGPGPRSGNGAALDSKTETQLRARRATNDDLIVVTSNPASAWSDPTLFYRTYLEPLDLDALRAIVLAERPVLVVAAFGGAEAEALARALENEGTLAAVGAKLGSRESVLGAASASAHGDAIAVSVDAASDGKRVVIAGVTEHLEPPFVHVGDAAAILPPFTLGPEIVARIEDRVRALALELGVVGLVGVRLAVSGEDIVVMDVERRAGITTAFVSRATGIPLVEIGSNLMLGKSLDELGITERALPRHVAAREAVFPRPGPDGDAVLGPEMRSIGEVIGIDDTPARAYAKALRGIGISVSSLRASPGDGAAPVLRCVLFSITEGDRAAAVELARRFRALGFEIIATADTAVAIGKARIPVRAVTGAEAVSAEKVAFAIVTARGEDEIAQTRPIRSACIAARIPCFTTMRLARLGCAALEEDPAPRIRALQDWYAES